MGTTGGSSDAGAAQDPEVFDLAGDPPPPPRPARPAARPVPQPAEPLSAAGGPAPLTYAPNLDARAFAAAPEFASQVRDLWVPAGLIAVSLGLGFAVAFAAARGNLRVALLAVSTYAVVKAVVVVVATVLLTRFLGAAFGRYEQAVLKLAAVALLPDAIVAATFGFAGICPGTLLGVPAGLLTAHLIFMHLCDQDGPEAVASTVVLLMVTAAPWVLWHQIFWRVMEIGG
jgi:hypothetical protein